VQGKFGDSSVATRADSFAQLKLAAQQKENQTGMTRVLYIVTIQ